ncbi:hypothetical protein BGZ61DRAFT_483440 [Ilyonectria robusta]|uniref:uncharacterized protein n=1 Tax=Ilyonectria robusta TaxID=1079257 RepID=UPI001E8EEA3A|nr:uncharacterized protein BGZ61DRAFT_483440 [Ilyonectria robusta]KAH8669249.1 hypothetical protein BGZ61DRAFT_483440 [Ilyonectria robusta]
MVPFIEFIVSDKKRSTVSFIKKLLEDERFSVTEHGKTIKSISRDVRQKTALQHAAWRVGFGEPITLGDIALENVRAIQNDRIYICLVALKIHDGILRSPNERRFLQEVNKVDLSHEIRRYAELTKMKSLRQNLLGRLWVGRGLVSISRAPATQAVLKPAGGFSLALRKRLNLVLRRSAAGVP